MNYRVRQINMGLRPSAPPLSRKRSMRKAERRHNMTKKELGPSDLPLNKYVTGLRKKNEQKNS